MSGELKFFIGISIGIGIGLAFGDLVLGISIGMALGAALVILIKSNKSIRCIYNFDLVAKIPTELKGLSKGVSVEDWFVESNDEYNILNQIDIDFDYSEEEFAVGVRIEKGDAFHKEYLYKHIKKVLRKFENDFNTKWVGEFYMDDGEKEYICYAPNFDLEVND